MTNIKKKVAETLKWKKNTKYCATKLGISESEYLELKQELRSERKTVKQKKRFFSNASKNAEIAEVIDLEKGTGKISGTFSHEPKSPEEIIQLLNIDTTVWKLSQYWNKQMGDHWRVSALVSRVKETALSNLEELLEEWSPKTFKIPKVNLSKINNGIKVCGIMSLQDIHFGKEGNETIDKDFEDTIINLMSRVTQAYYMEKLYFVVGGDLVNMDTFHGTTTGGTPVDNCVSSTEAYIQAFDAMHWAINYIKSFCKELTIVYVPGNHDRLSSFHLAHALSKSIESDEITWDVKYEERKVHVWGNNFNAFEHGDKRSKNNPLIYASEYHEEWGSTTNRTLYKGHIHTDRKVEYMTSNETAGFIEKTLPSLGKTDYYHYSNKFTGNRRSGKLELQDPLMGNICELTYQAT
jgi:DNA polymerase II small subunit/DNA polymerase delta subunit B